MQRAKVGPVLVTVNGRAVSSVNTGCKIPIIPQLICLEVGN